MSTHPKTKLHCLKVISNFNDDAIILSIKLITNYMFFYYSSERKQEPTEGSRGETLQTQVNQSRLIICSFPSKF